MPATTGMKGAGYYDQHSTAQLSAILALQDWVDDAVANLPLPPPEQSITVLDVGSSEGRNADRLMTTIVTGLRRRTDQPLQTIFSDLAGNDFNRLFTWTRPGAAAMWRPTPGPTPASCAPPPSRWYGRPSTNRRGKSGPSNVCTSVFELVCSPNRSATRGALSWWPPC